MDVAYTTATCCQRYGASPSDLSTDGPNRICMSDFQNNLKAALERAIIAANARTDEEIRAVAQQFRAFVMRRVQAKHGSNLGLAQRANRILDQAIVEFCMTAHEIKQDTSPTPGRQAETHSGNSPNSGLERSMLRPFLAGAFAAVCLIALVAFMAVRVGYFSELSVFRKDNERGLLIPAEDVLTARRINEEIAATVLKAQEILERDPESVLVENPDRFFNLRDVFPDLFESMPLGAKHGATVQLRRKGASYKILISGKFCPLANETDILKRDPKREGGLQVLCQFYGVWNEGGKDF